MSRGCSRYQAVDLESQDQRLNLDALCFYMVDPWPRVKLVVSLCSVSSLPHLKSVAHSRGLMSHSHYD